jgi:uncharacterized delta-60 repeat protein
LIASFQSTSRSAVDGEDYLGFASSAFWEENWLVDIPRSVGRVSTRFGFLPIIDDNVVEGDEQLALTVLQPSSSINLGGEQIILGGARGRFEAPVTIVDNDFNRGILAFSSPTYTVDENGLKVTLTVVRTNGSAGAVSVDYTTRNGTALAGQDYTAKQLTLTFAPGQVSRTIEIDILDDSFIEPDETFSLVLTNATGGAKFPGGTVTSTESAVVTIIDNDFAPGHINFAVSDFSVAENDGPATITVRRTGGSVAQVSVRLTTSPGGTATAGADYTGVDQVLTWDHGDTTPRLVAVPILNETPALVEGPETVFLTLSMESLPGLIGSVGTAILTIVDDDSYGTFEFSQAVYQGDENGGSAAITVLRLAGTAGTVLVDYEVAEAAPGAGDPSIPPATPGTEFVTATGVLQFLPGDTAKSFLVTLLDDTVQDGDKKIGLALTGVDFGVVGALNAGVLNVVDNETFNGPAGSLDPTFIATAGPNGDVLDMALQPDGKLLLAGEFTRLNGVTKSRLGRLNTDGSLDGTFNQGLGPNGAVRVMNLQPNGKILLGGFFTSIQGTNRNYLARINSDGTADTFFNPGTGPDNPVLAMALTAEGRIVIGGSFASYNSVQRPRVVMLNTNGTLYVPFNTGFGPDGDVFAVAVQRDGKVLIGGEFTHVNGVPRAKNGGDPSDTWLCHLPPLAANPHKWSRRESELGFHRAAEYGAPSSLQRIRPYFQSVRKTPPRNNPLPWLTPQWKCLPDLYPGADESR